MAEFVTPVSVIHTVFRGAPVTLTPQMRLRSTDPIVKHCGIDSFADAADAVSFDG